MNGTTQPPLSPADLVLETDRLRLRPYREEDVDALHRLWMDPQVRRYLWDDVCIPRDRAEVTVRESMVGFESAGFGQWIVSLRDDLGVIGFCGLSRQESPVEAELLYGLAPAFWHRGLATEAAHAMLRLGFEEHGLERIVAVADAPNVASIRVMERLGLRFVESLDLPAGPGVRHAIRRDEFRPGGGYHVLRRG